ncbi:MAG: MFS transporter [Eubacteriales bacterium]
MEKKKLNYLLLIGLICIAVNLRAPITAVGPLVPGMKTELPFSSGVFGLLTTIPLIMFAVFSPFVRRISDFFGAGMTLLYSVCIIALGVVLRSFAGIAGLFIGTVLLGVGIAVGNVLVPGIIKARFSDRLGLATGAFTVSMTSFAAISAAVSYPISAISGFGWRNSLAVWLLLSAVGIIVWLPHRSLSLNTAVNLQTQKDEEQPSIWRSSTAWWLTVLMGAQSFLFYFFAAWLPTIVQFKGLSPAQAGYIAFVFQLSTIPRRFVILRLPRD